MPTTCTPVSQRIQELEGGIYYLTLQLTYAGKTQSDRNRVDAELRVSLQALEHYRKALEFEGAFFQGLRIAIDADGQF